MGLFLALLDVHADMVLITIQSISPSPFPGEMVNMVECSMVK